MKKILCLLLIMSIILTGCGKSVEKKNDEVLSTDVETTENVGETTPETPEPTTEKMEETTKKTTTKKTTKKTTTKSWGKNMYKSTKTGKINKYTYTYADEATCGKKGDEHFDIVNKTNPYVAFGCEEVQDQNGKKVWGVYFYSAPDDKSIFYY